MLQKEIDIEAQWIQLTDTIEKYIGDRSKSLLALYESLANTICTAPASAHRDRHNCFPGGYIDHVNRVVRCSLQLWDAWSAAGHNHTGYTKEELVFSALNHDLGKVGDGNGEEYYVMNDSSWHVERGAIYKINPKLQFFKVPDRSLVILNKAGIVVSENEYLAIKLHDGLYSKGNESYLMAQNEFALRNDLPLLLHHADHLATMIEGQIHNVPQVSNKPKTGLKTQIINPKSDQAVGDSVINNFFKD